MFNDYAKNVSADKYETKYEEGLKILSLKQMFQRLQIAITQVKAANTCKNLLSIIIIVTINLYPRYTF